MPLLRMFLIMKIRILQSKQKLYIFSHMYFSAKCPTLRNSSFFSLPIPFRGKCNTHTDNQFTTKILDYPYFVELQRTTILFDRVKLFRPENYALRRVCRNVHTTKKLISSKKTRAIKLKKTRSTFQIISLKIVVKYWLFI